jgi:hypothetical protein
MAPRAIPQRGHLGNGDCELGRGQHVLAGQQRGDLEPGPDGLIGRPQLDHRHLGEGQPGRHLNHAGEGEGRLPESPEPFMERGHRGRARGRLVQLRVVGRQPGVGEAGVKFLAAQPVEARRGGLVPLPHGMLERCVQRRAAQLDARGGAPQHAGPARVVKRDPAGEQQRADARVEPGYLVGRVMLVCVRRHHQSAVQAQFCLGWQHVRGRRAGQAREHRPFDELRGPDDGHPDLNPGPCVRAHAGHAMNSVQCRSPAPV